MLKVLIKKQLQDLFQTFYIDKKTGRARDKKKIVSFLLFSILLFFSLGISFYSAFNEMGKVILNIDMDWLYFSIVSSVALSLGLFASVFNTYASLYMPRDNELMLSLPIPISKLVISRLIGVYAVSLLYSAWIWIPGVIAYFLIVPLTFTKVLLPCILIFILPLFVTFLSCILGFLVAIVASKTKGNSIFKILISIIFIIAYYVVYFNITNYITNISSYASIVGGTIKNWLHYIYLFSMAATGRVSSFLIVVLITVLLISLTLFILSKTFIKLSIIKENTKKNNNLKYEYKNNDLNKALLKREYKHFISSASWVLNGGFGLLVMLIAPIFIYIKKDSLILLINTMPQELISYSKMIPVLLLVGICFIISTNTILSVSISIEGKSLWILKSLPIDTKNIFKSKEKMFIQMNMIASSILVLTISYILKFVLYEVILILVALYVFSNLIADTSLIINLLNPNFTWTNEAALTKQSIGVVISLFGGWAFCMLTGYLSTLISNLGTLKVLMVIILAFYILYRLAHNYLMTKGQEIFKEL